MSTMSGFEALERLAPLLDQLVEDANARVSYELMSGGLVWSDELPPCDHYDFDDIGSLRALWRNRSTLIIDAPEDKFRAVWEQGQQLCPNWPGFNPQRRDSRWRQFFFDSQEKLLRDIDELDRRIQEQQKQRHTNTP